MKRYPHNNKDYPSGRYNSIYRVILPLAALAGYVFPSILILKRSTEEKFTGLQV